MLRTRRAVTPALAVPDLIRELRALLDRFGGAGMTAAPVRKARPRSVLLLAYAADLRRRNTSQGYVRDSIR